MTYKQIEASREARLWIGQVIVPAIIGAVTIASNPDARRFVEEKSKEVKEKVNHIFKK